MVYQTKRKILNSTVYIVLGLVITAVICITVATFVGMKTKTPAPQDDPLPDAATPAGNIDVPAKNPAGAGETPSADPGADGGTAEDPGSVTPAGETPASVPAEPVFCLPAAGTLLKEYSPELPIRSLTMNDYRTHAGIDISAPLGSAVNAMSDGTVADIWSDPMMGVCLSVDHGDGLLSVYKNLDAIFPDGIAKGAEVKAGQTVAAVGNTSLVELADVDHLHFEVTRNGKHIDPGSLVDLSALVGVDAGED